MHVPFRLHSSSAKQPLRIGVLLDRSVQPAWVAEVLDGISSFNFARLELVVYNSEGQPKKRTAWEILRDAKSRNGVLFNLYARWDRRRNEGSGHPLQPVDCAPLLSGVDSMVVTPVRKRFVHRFTDESLRRIRAANLDVLIRFGFGILRGEILGAARHGVWSYHHGDNDSYRGGPSYFWEMAEGNPISGATLQILTEELDAGRVLCKGYFATRKGLSWWRNRVQPYWGASTFILDKLRQLHEQGWESVEAAIPGPTAYRGKAAIYTTPTNRQMARWLAAGLARAALERLSSLLGPLFIEHWTLGIHWPAGPPGSPLDLGRFHWMRPPRGHFYADPFLFGDEGKRWVFFEDFDYATRLGSIACAEMLAGGGLTPAQTVLEQPYHLSYPCIFRAEGEIYMIPECRAHGTVELYRCTRFPGNWELAKVLLKASAVDTTVWSEGGLHWFFVTLREQRGGALQLWLFYSTEILGNWTPHPCNPISTDVRSSRGGGAIYREGERLIRPSQDCSGNYGRSFTLNEVEILTQQEYRERPYLTVEPPQGMIGTHTYGRLDEVEIVDGCALRAKSKVLDMPSLVARIRHKLGFKPAAIHSR